MLQRAMGKMREALGLGEEEDEEEDEQSEKEASEEARRPKNADPRLGQSVSRSACKCYNCTEEQDASVTEEEENAPDF